MTKKFRPIILAGGIGKRLWPFSTKANPKQFIPIFQDLSLFDLTLQRVNKTNLFKKPIVVTAERYLDQVLISSERTGLECELIVLEPEGKNTFPAVTLAISLSLDKYSEESFLVMPSDHYISMNKSFYYSCREVFKQIEKNCLMLFGVRPEFPSSQFGYILTSEGEGGSFFKVKEFIEKPTFKKAKSLLKKQNVFWNSGIFAFKGKWFIEEIKKTRKAEFNNVLDSISLGENKGNIFKPHKESFKKLESISLDKAMVEKRKRVSMVTLDAGWSDLGSWTNLSSFHKDPSSSFSLNKEGSYTRIERPWGFFDVLMESNASKVKMINVMPKQKLSLQRHKHRSETWHVIQGRAKVTRGKEKFTLERGDSVIIERNQLHSLENTEDISLEIIEIQTGNYLGEDDIVRIEDIYGRADLH